jgi:hypothetical protein
MDMLSGRFQLPRWLSRTADWDKLRTPAKRFALTACCSGWGLKFFDYEQKRASPSGSETQFDSAQGVINKCGFCANNRLKFHLTNGKRALLAGAGASAIAAGVVIAEHRAYVQ